jgi:hypothetical protein
MVCSRESLVVGKYVLKAKFFLKIIFFTIVFPE